MSHRVGHRLLCHAVESRGYFATYLGSGCIGQDFNRRAATQPRLASQMLQRWHQSAVLKHARMYRVREHLHFVKDATGNAPDAIKALLEFRITVGAIQGAEFEKQSRQRLCRGVVQLAGNACTLRITGSQHLRCHGSQAGPIGGEAIQ
jgi:hypothetical protein